MQTAETERPTIPIPASNTFHPKTLSDGVARLLAKYESGELNPWNSQLDDHGRFACFKTLAEDRGRRYAGCTLDTFTVTMAAQVAVVEKLKRLEDSDFATCRTGGGLVLYGPEGTGKDHLQFAMLRSAILESGISAMWRDGLRLQDEIRQAVGNSTEPELRKKMREPLILAISDPMPPTGDKGNGLNEWNLSWIRDVVDRRYQDMKSTWITFNGATTDELKKVLFPPLTARLLESSLVLHCNWSSYRKKL